MKAPDVPWLETQATVTACTYQFARMNTFTLGFPTTRGPFRISFSYYAHGKTYNNTFTARRYLEQGAHFPITYNPLAPNENSKSSAESTAGTPLFVIGIAGSIILSLLYLAFLRGCS